MAENAYTVGSSRPVRPDRATAPAAARVAPPRSGVLAALAAFALASGLASLVTITRLRDAAIEASLAGASLTPGRLLAALGPLDLLLALACAAALLWLASLEWRGRHLTNFLQDASQPQALAALAILLPWLGHCYFSPGVLLGGDTGSHISRYLEVARGLDEGVLSAWTNYQYTGAPLLWFTGPLLYVVGGAAAWLIGDAVVAAKVVLFATQVASGFLFFALLRRLDVRPGLAAVAACGFAGCFALLHLFLYRGVFPQALTIVFLLLLFFAAEGLMRARGALWANWLAFALATAGLVVNHQPHALFSALYLGLFGAASLALGRWRWAGLPAAATAGIAGALMSAVAVWPVIAEAGWVMIVPGDALMSFELPGLKRLSQLVLWRNTRTTFGTDYWAYLGIGLLLLAVIGGVAALRGRLGPERRALAVAVLPCLALCLVMRNPVVRDIMFIALFVGLLAALGLEHLWRCSPRRWLPLLTLLLLADVASTAIQPVARTDKGHLVAIGTTLERIAPNERYMEMSLGRDGAYFADMGPVGGPGSYYATVQRLAGNHNMAATPVHNWMAATVMLAERDLARTGRLAPERERLLAMLNASRIICVRSAAVGCPESFAGRVPQGLLGEVVPIAGASPVRFSQRLDQLVPGSGLEKPMLWESDIHAGQAEPVLAGLERFMAEVLRVEAPGPVPGTIEAIAVRDPLPPFPAGSDADWRPALTGYEVGLRSVSLSVSSDRPAWIQLAHPWFPATELRVNGQVVEPLRGALNLIVAPIPAGDTRIELLPRPTPARSLAVQVSSTALLATLAITAVLAFRGRRARATESAAPGAG